MITHYIYSTYSLTLILYFFFNENSIEIIGKGTHIHTNRVLYFLYLSKFPVKGIDKRSDEGGRGQTHIYTAQNLDNTKPTTL